MLQNLFIFSKGTWQISRVFHNILVSARHAGEIEPPASMADQLEKQKLFVKVHGERMFSTRADLGWR
jgi:hypothetical protein